MKTFPTRCNEQEIYYKEVLLYVLAMLHIYCSLQTLCFEFLRFSTLLHQLFIPTVYLILYGTRIMLNSTTIIIINEQEEIAVLLNQGCMSSFSRIIKAWFFGINHFYCTQSYFVKCACKVLTRVAILHYGSPSPRVAKLPLVLVMSFFRC